MAELVVIKRKMVGFLENKSRIPELLVHEAIIFWFYHL
jgi:hypothetical protein